MIDASQINTSCFLVLTLLLTTNLFIQGFHDQQRPLVLSRLCGTKKWLPQRNNEESQTKITHSYNLIKLASWIFPDVLSLLQIFKVLYKFKHHYKKLHNLPTLAYLNFYFKEFYNWKNSVANLEITQENTENNLGQFLKKL